MLLDAPSLYFRAFFGVPQTVVAPDGTPVNAVRGLLDMLARLVGAHRPTHLVAAMDASWRPAFRVGALPSYKAHRLGPDGVSETTPEALVPQVPVIEALLDALGIARIGVPGYEADDVIGTLAERARVTGSTVDAVDVVTGDRDLFQLVDDERGVRVLYTAARGVGNAEAVDEGVLRERYGIPGRAYADFALLRGDPSDGLPGVPGIGEKTAAALVSRFGDLAGLLAAVESGDPALPRTARARLLAARDYLDAAPVVVRVALDVPLPAYDGRLPRHPAEPATLLALAERHGLAGPLDRLVRALGALPPQPANAENRT